MPVLPLVGSTMTLTPGVSSPSRSAASIMASPMRSLTLLAGFALSSLATICGRTPDAIRFSRTSGVLPMSSATLLAIFMGAASDWAPSITRDPGRCHSKPSSSAVHSSSSMNTVA